MRAHRQQPRIAAILAAAYSVLLASSSSVAADAPSSPSSSSSQHAGPSSTTSEVPGKTVAQVDGSKKARVARATKPAAPRPVRPVTIAPSTSPALADQLRTALNDEAIDGADVGYYAVNLTDGSVVAETGADTLINPASNAKLITAAVALDTLKPEYRFKTEYFVQGVLRDGTLNGNLVVKGYGDPSIVSERLIKVANELYLLGVEKITGSVIVDDSWFDAVDEPRGWELEDAPDRAYAAPISALMVNYNAVAVYVRPGAEPGKPAVVRLDPPTETVTLQGGVGTERLGRGVHVVSQKHLDPATNKVDGTLITVEGTTSVRDAPERIYRRVWDPARHFGSVLTAFLQQRGVTMKHSVVRGTVPDGARLVLVDRSEPLFDVVARLNHYSNNIIAETLIKTVGAETLGAPGTFDNGLAVAHRFLEQKAGWAPGSYVFGNGSGLNDVNRVTARQLVQLLRAVSSNYEISTEFFTALAVAGTRGTIGFRMKDTPAQRHLRAKTGTLRGVSALSGTVVQPDGNVIAFSFLSQGLKKGASAAWKVQNALGIALASNGMWNPKQDDDVVEGDTVSELGTWRPVEMAPGGAP